MADALDSGSSEVTLVWVQLPSTAFKNQEYIFLIFLFSEKL